MPAELSLSLRSPHSNPVYTSSVSGMCYMPSLSDSCWFDHWSNTWLGAEFMKLLIMYFSPFPCYLVPSEPKYSPQHPTLKHPQPALLPQCERPCFTPMQNSRQYYSPVYLNLYMFWISNWKTKVSTLRISDWRSTWCGSVRGCCEHGYEQRPIIVWVTASVGFSGRFLLHELKLFEKTLWSCGVTVTASFCRHCLLVSMLWDMCVATSCWSLCYERCL